MNKLYSQIASLLVVVGLGTAWAFSLITLESLSTIAPVLLALIYGLYQKYEQGVLETKNLELEDQTLKLKTKLEEADKYASIQTNAFKSLSKKYLDLSTNATVSSNEPKVSLTQEQVEIPAEKPKRKYYKSKKS